MPNAAYDEIADWYETEFLPTQRFGSEHRAFADLIGVDQAIAELLGSGTGTCLEVGCGTGIYAERVGLLGWTPVGLDISARMLSYTLDRLPAARGDAMQMPLAPASVDAAMGIMIHSDLASFDTVLDEIHRVLRPGGQFLHVGVHPCFIGSFADRDKPPEVTVGPGYLDEGWTPGISPTAGKVGENGQVRDKVGAAHYSLATLFNAFIDAGFQVERVAEGFEPVPITLSVLLRKPASAR